MYYLFSFRSRNQSMRFYDSLKRQGVYSRIISTPGRVSVGCGLSVQVAPDLVDAARRVFGFNNYDAFLGLFLIEGNSVTRVGNR